MKYLVTIMMMLSLVACKKNNEKKPNTIASSVQTEEEAKPDLNKGYWHLEGTIGDIPVALELTRIDSFTETGGEENSKYFSGKYYYLNEEKPISLYQSDTIFVDNKLNLSAYVDGKDEVFTGTFDGLTYKGEWSANGKKLNFELKETYKNGSIDFQLFSLNKAIPYEKNQATYQIQFATPRQSNAITDTIKTALFGSKAKGDFAKLMNVNYENYKDSYIKDVKEMTDDNLQENMGAFMNFSASSTIFPIVNTKNRIVLEYYTYEFTGGAHGMHGSFFYNYDVAQQKFLKTEDIFKASESQLNTFINEQVRLKYKVKPNQNLQDVTTDDASFITDAVPFTENFKLSKKGVTFYYNVYDVTPYAMGPYEFFVSYDKLKPYLNPNFKY